MNIHMNRPNENEVVGEIDIERMKRYVAYCKSCVFRPLVPLEIDEELIWDPSRCAPRLSAEAAEMLSSHFVGLRKQVQQVEKDTDERSSIPITVR